jgi:hypothetical protein
MSLSEIISIKYSVKYRNGYLRQRHQQWHGENSENKAEIIKHQPVNNENMASASRKSIGEVSMAKQWRKK